MIARPRELGGAKRLLLTPRPTPPHRRVAGPPSFRSATVSGTRREDPERGEHEELRTEETEAAPREQLAVRRRVREHVPRSQEPLARRGPEQRDTVGRVPERVEDAVTSDDERDEHALPSPSTRRCDGGGDEAARPGKRDGMERGTVRDGAVPRRSESRGDDVDIRQQSQSREDGCPADERPGPNARGRLIGRSSVRRSGRASGVRRAFVSGPNRGSLYPRPPARPVALPGGAGTMSGGPLRGRPERGRPRFR